MKAGSRSMDNLIAVDRLEARGHPNIRATHKSTLEITRDQTLTLRGDCIIAVAATKAAADLHPQLKQAIRSGERVTLLFIAEEPGLVETVTGRGHSALTLEDSKSIVVRRSSYVDSRTIAVNADKAAWNIDRKLVAYLKQPGATLKVYIVVHRGEFSLDFIRELHM
ncbi:MAG: DUF371 domain-containing protein [Thermofilum sp.]